MIIKCILFALFALPCLGAVEGRMVGPMVNDEGRKTIYFLVSENEIGKLLVKFNEDKKGDYYLIAKYQLSKAFCDVSFEIIEHKGRRLAVFAITNDLPAPKVAKVCFLDLDDKDIDGGLKISWVTTKSDPGIWRMGMSIANEAALILDIDSAVNKFKND